MTIRELIEHLSQFDEDINVMILDGFNGDGNKRDINFNPSILRKITEKDEKECGDCNDRVGEEIVLLGYGFY